MSRRQAPPLCHPHATTLLAATPNPLPQLQKAGLRQYGFAASGALRGVRSQAAGATRSAAGAALRRPVGMAGSSLLRAAGRRLKSTVTEFRSLPNAAEAYGPAALTSGLTPGQRRQLALWLGTCSAWVFVLVVVGGITRLTRSGLSMTSWKFTGEKPPSNPVRVRSSGSWWGWQGHLRLRGRQDGACQQDVMAASAAAASCLQCRAEQHWPEPQAAPLAYASAPHLACTAPDLTAHVCLLCLCVLPVSRRSGRQSFPATRPPLSMSRPTR